MMSLTKMGKMEGDEDDHDPSEITVEQVFDLALRKTVVGNGPFEPGDNVTFRIEVINQGTLVATDIQISDYIPANFTLNDGNWTESGGIASLNTPIASLAAESNDGCFLLH